VKTMPAVVFQTERGERDRAAGAGRRAARRATRVMAHGLMACRDNWSRRRHERRFRGPDRYGYMRYYERVLVGS